MPAPRQQYPFMSVDKQDNQVRLFWDGKHQLFNSNSKDIFKVKLIHCSLLAKIYYDILSLKWSSEFFVCFGIAFILHFLGKRGIFYPKGVGKQE